MNDELAKLTDAHKAGHLFIACRAALDLALAQTDVDYERVECYAHLCQLLQGPCIDHDEDITTLALSDYNVVNALVALAAHDTTN